MYPLSPSLSNRRIVRRRSIYWIETLVKVADEPLAANDLDHCSWWRLIGEAHILSFAQDADYGYNHFVYASSGVVNSAVEEGEAGDGVGD